jgi:hypothetical protein
MDSHQLSSLLNLLWQPGLFAAHYAVIKVVIRRTVAYLSLSSPDLWANPSLFQHFEPPGSVAVRIDLMPALRLNISVRFLCQSSKE